MRPTCVTLVVFQHIDLLGKLAVALFALVLFDALVKLHVVPQSVLGLHACRKTKIIFKNVYCWLNSEGIKQCSRETLTFPTLRTQVVSVVVVNPEVLLQHVFPRE